jgi:hypothetical protein
MKRSSLCEDHCCEVSSLLYDTELLQNNHSHLLLVRKQRDSCFREADAGNGELYSPGEIPGTYNYSHEYRRGIIYLYE